MPEHVSVSTGPQKPEKMPPFLRRFLREHLIATLLYVVVLMASVTLLQRFEFPLLATVALALTPVVPALLMLAAYLRALRSMDEMQRRIQHESILIAAGTVAFGSFSYGFLEGVDVAPHIPGALLFVLPALVAAWGVALIFVARRYK